MFSGGLGFVGDGRRDGGRGVRRFLPSIGTNPTVIASAMVAVEEMKEEEEQDEEGKSVGEEVSSCESEGVLAEEGGDWASAILAEIDSMGFEEEVDWLQDMILKVGSMGLEEMEEWKVIGAKRLAQLEVKGRGLEGKKAGGTCFPTYAGYSGELLAGTRHVRCTLSPRAPYFGF